VLGPSLLDSPKGFLGALLSSSLTSFLRLPTDKHLSAALATFFPRGLALHAAPVAASALASPGLLGPVYAPAKADAEGRYGLESHPSPHYAALDVALLHAHAAAAAADTTVSVRRVAAPRGVAGLPLLRCDVTNMTRHVHHHFDYALDGHTRTYTMTVELNATATAKAEAALGLPPGQGLLRGAGSPAAASGAASGLLGSAAFLRGGHASPVVTSAAALPLVVFREAAATEPGGVGRRFLEHAASGARYELPLGHHLNGELGLVSVTMVRDKSTHVIPYNAIRAVTLIAVLRLGLLKALKERAYGLFVGLPLYEDMAPWNIVFVGGALDYIDYDTRDKTFDADVQRTYQVLSVLMNYKRTVSDFSKCGQKVGNPYNFPFLSECVKSAKFSGPCDEPAFPVACGDGQCRSDYITCLRATVEGDTFDNEKAGASATKVAAAKRQAQRGFGGDSYSWHIGKQRGAVR